MIEYEIKGKELKYILDKEKWLTDKKMISINPTKAIPILARGYSNWNGNYIKKENVYRKLTPIEVERCFGLPDNYTKGISTSARYHGLGNGWEVKTIVEFFKHIPKTNQ